VTRRGWLCIYILWEAGCTSGVHPGAAAILGHLPRFLRDEIESWLEGRAARGDDFKEEETDSSIKSQRQGRPFPWKLNILD
jgi:hypothetical protein